MIDLLLELLFSALPGGKKKTPTVDEAQQAQKTADAPPPKDIDYIELPFEEDTSQKDKKRRQ